MSRNLSSVSNRNANNDTASYFLSTNLIHGDAMTMRDADGGPITVVEWSYLGKVKFNRRDFRLDVLTGDRLGRRATFMVLLVSQAKIVFVYLFVPLGFAVTLLMGFIVGTLQGGLAAAMLPTFTEFFPTSIRASGTGFCLNGGRGFGSVMPATVGILATTIPLGQAMGACALASYALAFVAAMLLPARKAYRTQSKLAARFGLPSPL